MSKITPKLAYEILDAYGLAEYKDSIRDCDLYKHFTVLELLERIKILDQYLGLITDRVSDLEEVIEILLDEFKLKIKDKI